MGWLSKLFGGERYVSFANKTDAEIVETFNNCSSKKRGEIIANICKLVALSETVAGVRGIPLDRFVFPEQVRNYTGEEFYDLTTYNQLKHVHKLLSKK